MVAHVQHLLRQLSILIGLVFGFVVLEVLLLVDSVIWISLKSFELSRDSSGSSLGLTGSGEVPRCPKQSGPPLVDPVALE